MKVQNFYTDPMNQTPHPIDAAAEILGSQAALANALGVTRAAVTQWKEEGRRTPAEHCPKIQRLTGGRVTCKQLRDDIDWDAAQLVPEEAPGQSFDRRRTDRREATQGEG